MAPPTSVAAAGAAALALAGLAEALGVAAGTAGLAVAGVTLGVAAGTAGGRTSAPEPKAALAQQDAAATRMAPRGREAREGLGGAGGDRSPPTTPAGSTSICEPCCAEQRQSIARVAIEE